MQGVIAGDYVFTLDSRQMGKSSLCIRALVKLNGLGYRTAFLDLTKFGVRNITPDQWFMAMLRELGRSLGLASQMLDYWKSNSEIAPVQRFFGAIQEIALNSIQGRIAIFIDEIDVTRSLPFDTDEFFAGIRQCYIGRATNPSLQRLTFSLFGTASPSDLIQDTRVSPFNIGRRVELRDFQPDEAKVLAEGLPGNKKDTLQRILYWTGGHPYLTQRLCQEVSQSASTDVDGICRSLFLERRAKESDDNLAFVRDRLLKAELDVIAILDLYADIRAGKKVKDDPANPICSVLRMAGITRAEKGILHVRNRIYADVFDSAWVQTHLPDAEERRRKAAYWTGVFRATTLGFTVLVAVTALAIYAFSQARLARTALDQARGLTQSLRKTEGDLRDALTKTNSALDNATQSQKEFRNAASQAEYQRGLAKLAAGKAAQEASNAKNATSLANQRLSHTLVATAFQHLNSSDPAGAIAPLTSALQLDRNDPHRALMHRIRLEYALRAASNLSQIWSGDGEMLDAEFLPQDTSAITANSDGRITVWDSRTGHAIGPVMRHKGLTCVSITKDKKTIVSGSNSGEIILWDIASRQPRQTFHITGSLKKLSFSDDGMLLAGATRVFGPTGHTDVWIWNLKSGRIVSHAFQAPTVVRFTTLAFSPNAKRIVIGASNYIAWSIDLGDGYGNHSISSCYNTMQATFLHSGNGLIINGASPPGTAGVAQICLATTGNLLRKLSSVKSDAEEGTALRLSRDGESVLTATDHGTLQVFSVRSGARIGPTIRSSVSVLDCDLSPDGSYAAVAGADGSIRTWNLETGDPVGSVLWHRQEATKVRFDRSGTHLLSCSRDGSARLWSIKANGIEEFSSNTTNLNNPTIFFWTPKNELVATDMNSIYQWNPDGTWKRILDGYRFFHPRVWADSQSRVVVIKQDFIRVFDFNSNTFITPPLRCASGIDREMAYATLSRDCRYLFDQFEPHRARVLDLDRKGQQISKLTINEPIAIHQVSDRDDRISYGELVIASQTDRLAAIMSSGQINIWSLRSGKLIRSTPCGPGTRYLGACPSSERFCAYQSVNGIWTIRVFNAKDGQVCTLINGLNAMTDIVLSQHGDRMVEVISGRVWDTTRNRIIRTCPSLPIDHSMVVLIRANSTNEEFFHPITRKIHRFDTGEAISEPLIDTPSTQGQFSADGKYLGISTATSLKSINLQTKHASELINVGSSSLPGFAMKGELLTGILRTRIGFWDPETGEQVLPNLPAEDAMSNTQFSNDGTAYVCRLGNSVVVRRITIGNSTDQLLTRAADALSLQKADSKTWNKLLAKRTGLPFTQTAQDRKDPSHLDSTKIYQVQDAMGDSGLPEESASALLNAAKAEVGAGLWENAAESIRRAKAAGANQPGVLFLEGNIALQLGNYAKAEASFVNLLAIEHSKLALISAYQAAVGARDFRTALKVLESTSLDESTSFRFRKTIYGLLTHAVSGNATAVSQFETYLDHCRTSETEAYDALGSLFARTAADLNASQNRWSELRKVALDQEEGDLDAQAAKSLLEYRMSLPLSGPEANNSPEAIFGIALRSKSGGKAKFLAALQIAHTKLQRIIQQNNCRTLEDSLNVLRTLVLQRECDYWIAESGRTNTVH